MTAEAPARPGDVLLGERRADPLADQAPTPLARPGALTLQGSL
ncbi:hypothetical protein WME91_07045 [Sorangium sp. So ce269]